MLAQLKNFSATAIFLLFALPVGTALSATAPSSQPQASDIKKPSKATTQTVKNLFYCPPIKAIKKNPQKMTWSAPNGWKSYESSFINKIHTFRGAQWKGVNVGQITCVYAGMKKNTFPVLLVFHTLTLEPHSGKWSKNLGSYRNCISNKQKDCSFKMRLRPKKQDLYKEAEKLKSKSNRITNPGF